MKKSPGRRPLPKARKAKPVPLPKGPKSPHKTAPMPRGPKMNPLDKAIMEGRRLPSKNKKPGRYLDR